MWRCFLIVEHEPRVEQLVIHGGAFGDGPLHRTVFRKHVGMRFDDRPKMDDMEWPETCLVEGCEHRLGDRERSLMGTTSWRRSDTGEVRDQQHEFGPGAMFDATDWNDWWAERSPDGRVWAVVLPPATQSSFWIIDGEASSGGFWTRVGTPPDISVTPSILIPEYHGFLGSNGTPPGYLSDDLEGRRY